MSQKVNVVLQVTSKGIESFSKVNGALDRFNTKVTNVFRRIVNLPNIIVGTAVGGMTATLLKADMQMQAIENRLDAAIGKFTSTSEEMSYLKDEANRLGISFVNLAHSYSGFSASATRAGISLEDTREIFKNIAETSVSLTLSGEKTRMVFLALEQMASKGKVSMEELRRQLGEHLPGALEIAARSMGMTTREFNKAISNGEIFAAEFLPKFSRAVREELGGSFEKASGQLLANTQRWQTAFFVLKQKAGDTLNPIANEIIKNLTIKMGEWGKAIEENKEKITKALEKVPYYFERILSAVTKFAKYIYEHREVIYLVGLSLAFSQAIVAINNFRIAMIALWAVMNANPIILVASALVALGVVSGLTAKNAEEYKKALVEDKVLQEKADKINRLTTVLELYNQRLDELSITQEESQTRFIEGNAALEKEIKHLETVLGGYGIALEGGLFKKIDIAKEKLNELTGKTKSASDEIQNAYNKIIPPKLGDAGKGKKAKEEKDEYPLSDEYAPEKVWARVSLVSPELKKQVEEFNTYTETKLNELSDKYEEFNVRLMTNDEIFAQRRKELWDEQKEHIESSMKSAFMTLVDLEGTFQDKVAAILKGFYRLSMSMMYDWLTEYVKAKLYEQTVNLTVERSKQSENITTAATKAAEASAAYAQPYAEIPYVGAILAAAAFASLFGTLIGLIMRAKKYAIGTRYATPGMAIVGERGPEIMQMRGGERIIPNDKINTGNVTFNLTIQGNADKTTIDHAVGEMKKFAQLYYNSKRYGYLKPSLVS